MRKTLIMLLLLTVAVTHLAAKDDDPDARFVKVTLKDGKTVEGWLPKKNDVFNCQWSFKLCNAPDTKKGTEYKAEQVKSLLFPRQTTEHPKGWLWENVTVYWYLNIYTRSFKTFESLLPLEYRGDKASAYTIRFWSPPVPQAHAAGVWVAHSVLYIPGAPHAFLIYNHGVSKSEPEKYIRKQFADYDPALGEYLYEWYHADSKMSKKQISDDESTLVRVYEQYLKEKKQKR